MLSEHDSKSNGTLIFFITDVSARISFLEISQKGDDFPDFDYP